MAFFSEEHEPVGGTFEVEPGDSCGTVHPNPLRHPEVEQSLELLREQSDEELADYFEETVAADFATSGMYATAADYLEAARRLRERS